MEQKLISPETKTMEASFHIAIGIILFKSNIDILGKCLTSLRNQSFNKLNVKINLGLLDNDNGSQLDIVYKLAKSIGIEVHLLLSANNIGFGGGHNHLFRELDKNFSNIDYYICMNPDGIPHHLMIENLLNFAFLKEDRGIFEARQFPIEHPKVYDRETFTTNWCSGCCVLIPKNIYHQLQGFDEIFFMYCEDIDISWRVKIHGYECFTVASAIFHHYTFSQDRNRALEFLYTKFSLYKLAVKYDIKILRFLQILRLLKCINRPIKLLELILTSNKIEVLSTTKQQRDEFINFKNGGIFSEVKF
jgi:N-acetylglucosaminyl-diphospho-decaprenol L-rhamnosyltransferase